MGKKTKSVPEVVRKGNTDFSNKPSRTWEIVINNYTDKDIEWLNELECNKILVAKEIGEQGTPHLQGRITFKRNYRLTQLKKLHAGAHWEVTMASSDWNYCKKVDSEIIINKDLREPGSRTDLVEHKDNIMAGQNVSEIVLNQPMLYHQYGRTFEKIEDLRLATEFRTKMTLCDWVYGGTGSGKSHYAFKDFHPSTHYVWTNDKGWWNKYRGQKIVIINDFRGEIPYNTLLQLIDKWPMDVPRRGRDPIPFVSEKIIITSSLHPKDIYKNREVEDELAQLLRRITLIKMDKSSSDQPFGSVPAEESSMEGFHPEVDEMNYIN